MHTWYEVSNAAEIDSPALLIYPDRIRHNIQTMTRAVGGDPSRLIPHIKTHKMREIVAMQIEAGIRRFKCATIAELEIALEAGAESVLMAYQLTGPKIARFTTLRARYPRARVSSLVDNLDSARQLASASAAEGMTAVVYFDVNNGNNRTGHPVNADLLDTYRAIHAVEGVELAGLHVYDGHIRGEQALRQAENERAFAAVEALMQSIAAAGLPEPELIMGGSPLFSDLARRANVYCSPGTVLLWDDGYGQGVPELDIQHAAVLLTRVISKPAADLITLDLGHKAVGSENPLDKRIRLLNCPVEYAPVGQSEEHLVLRVPDSAAFSVGDALYGIPYHVCPSVALYDLAHVVRDGRWAETWEVRARRRVLSV